MAAIVGLVEARPETIFDDYRRVLELGRVQPPASDETATLVTLAGGGDPGFGVPSWQPAGVARAWGLEQGDYRNRNLPGTCPAHVDEDMLASEDGRPVLLSVPSLEAGWGVRNAVAMWAAARGTGVSDPRRELAALTAALRQPDVPRPAVVCDGVLWGVGAGSTGRSYLVRNVLLAGEDPLAVDCLALQLAGLDPGDFPWLGKLHEEGLGTCDPSAIEIRGHAELVAKAFAGARWCGPGGCPRAGRTSPADLIWRLTRRKRMLRRYRESAWGRLAVSCT